MAEKTSSSIGEKIVHAMKAIMTYTSYIYLCGATLNVVLQENHFFGNYILNYKYISEVDMNRKIELESSVDEILDILHTEGEGYVVGGYVRDKLLNLTPEDCDFVTDIDYETLHELFKKHSPKEFGKQFGILEIKYKGHTYEIARYRIDMGAPEDRKLQEVVFTKSIEEDLRRRDFTVNSIAFDGKSFVSVPEAFQDLENRVIRFNGDPKERIKEDPLRILRGIRFAVTKDFHLDSPEVYRENMELIRKLSSERIRDEFIKILLSSNVARGMELLYNLKAIDHIIPEFPHLSPKNHRDKTVFFSVLEQLSLCPPTLVPRLVIFFKLLEYFISDSNALKISEDFKTPDRDNRSNSLKFSVFSNNSDASRDLLSLKDFSWSRKLDKSGQVEKILKSLKFDSRTISLVSLLIRNRVQDLSKIRERDCRILLSKIGRENLSDFLEILRGDISERYPNHAKDIFRDFKRCFEKIIIEGQPLSKKDLKINGKDLNALGYSGKIVGEILDDLLQVVLEDPDMNEYEYLEDIVTKYEES